MTMTSLPLKKVRNKNEIKALYHSAFPQKERLPWSAVRLMTAMKQYDLTAYYDGDALCGFAYTLHFRDALFVLYLAVKEELRGKGYGSGILEQLKQSHPNKTIFLNIEPPDENAPNAGQRQKRLAFYRKNGFYETGYEMTEVGGTFRVLSTRPDADFAACVGESAAKMFQLRKVEA